MQPYKDKLMKDRPALTGLFGELAYDKAGAAALQKNQEPDDFYITNPLKRMPNPLTVAAASLMPDLEVKSGKPQLVFSWDIVQHDYKSGDMTKENAFWRTLLDILPFTSSDAGKRQLAQDLQNKYVKYALNGARILDYTVDGNVAVLKVQVPGGDGGFGAGNGFGGGGAHGTVQTDLVPVPLDGQAKQILQKQGPEALLKYASKQKVDKIGDDLYNALKNIAKQSSVGKSDVYWWIATSPYETTLVDGKFRNEVNEDLPKEDIRNTNAAEFYGKIVSNAAKDKQLQQEMEKNGVPKSYVQALQFAGDVSEDNQKWLFGLTDKPNVAPKYGNTTMKQAATYGAGTVMLIGGFGSAIGGNLWLGIALIAGAALLLGYLMWKSAKEGDTHVRRRSRKVYH
ncbi:MAG: hypothetical protein GXN93_04820 [Candidatus Diapherotrites archaeon]|nr:hypothetical protein [Candidatus Diapherotrites archaeon]